jgi:hypothetical protein
MKADIEKIFNENKEDNFTRLSSLVIEYLQNKQNEKLVKDFYVSFDNKLIVGILLPKKKKFIEWTFE